MSSIFFAVQRRRRRRIRLALEGAPDEPTNHEKDYEYDCQCEGNIVAACPAGRVHVTQDVSPGRWSAAPKKGRNPGAALSRRYVRIGFGCSTPI
jgi:hypothetical protein